MGDFSDFTNWVTAGSVLGQHYPRSHTSRLKETLRQRAHSARGLYTRAAYPAESDRRRGPPGPQPPAPAPARRDPRPAFSEARGHDASQRPGLRVAEPARALRPAPPRRPALALGAGRREGKGRPRAGRSARRPARGAPLAPRTYLGARGLPELPAAQPQQGGPHGPAAAAAAT